MDYCGRVDVFIFGLSFCISMNIVRYKVLDYIQKMGGYLEQHHKGDLVKYSDHLEEILKLNVEIKKLKQQLTKIHKLTK